MEPDSYTIYNDAITPGDNPMKPDLWDNYFKPLIDLNTYVTCDDDKPLAVAVLEAYNIPCFQSIGHPHGNASTANFNYGTLPDIDIKRMDAMTVLRNSLMEESFKGPYDRFIEAIVNAEGEVEFIEVGANTTNIGDVYYSIQTGQYVDEPKGVMVTAGKPVPRLKPLEWKPIWYNEPENRAPIYAANSMLTNCMETSWKSYATIVFNDPNLDSKYEDGIDNLYELNTENPWDEIMGYAVYIEPPESIVTKKTVIQYNSETEIPIQISTRGTGNLCAVGTLYTMPTYDPTEADPDCWKDMTGNEVDYEKGVKVIIPDHFRYENRRESRVDKFIGIANVFIIGREIDSLYARPIDGPAALKPMDESNAEVWVSMSNKRRTMVRLDQGRHYVVAYADTDEDSDQEISIVFSQETRVHDLIQYGNGTESNGVKFRMNPLCEMAKTTEFESQYNYRTIIPWNKTKGIMVDEIWVTAKVETPSITVYDPDGRNEKALRIAENLKYYVAPLVMVNPPAPIGYKSVSREEVIDQIPMLRDSNPTTVQDFDNTPMETAMDEMQGSGMAVTFGFLTGQGDDPEQVFEAAGDEALQAADTIYNMMNSDVTETVYTCGPDADPQLGDRGPAGGIINSIRYSYNDQGSYTISVTEGPTLIGNLVQVDGGPSQKMAEDNSARGMVVQTLGDNLHFKVRIDGFGERWAVNTSHNFIRQGDVVQCTIHNNPVEA